MINKIITFRGMINIRKLLNLSQSAKLTMTKGLSEKEKNKRDLMLSFLLLFSFKI